MQDSGSESRDIPLHLIDMATAIERIREVAGETNLDALRDDWRRLAILERQVAILSEASRRLNEDEKQLTVEIPWREIAAIGNILRHEYKRVDVVILWDVCTVHLEPLSMAIERMIRMQR
ncbi:MAG: DUF86 domain-containing protein [Alphaproteobacteria bacterium]|nr:DUF86 domain-containing protein [Alphaproteobacteria bacterium]MBM3654995.1 DUF86 domain-containing protein [Alphaproteobacteria bacterium]